MKTATRTLKANSQIARLMKGVMWRNLVAGLVERARQRTAWLLRQAHTEATYGEPEKEGPFLIFGQKNVL